jgi:hypothetical protein
MQENNNDLSPKEKEAVTHPTALRHFHSLPVKPRMGDLNPRLFRLSRSGLNDVSSRELEVGADQRQSEETLPSSTIWKSDNIEFVPSPFQVQRTHCIIYDQSTDMILNNISKYLDEVAVGKVYDNKNVIAHVELKGDLMVLIRLFKAKENGDDVKDGGILVEITRRQGCSAQYHSEATKILCAAKGLDKEDWEINESSRKVRTLDVPTELKHEYLKQMNQYAE